MGQQKAKSDAAEERSSNVVGMTPSGHKHRRDATLAARYCAAAV